MGGNARVGDVDVMPGLGSEPLWPWNGRQGGRRQPTGTGADRLVGRRALFRSRGTFLTAAVTTSLLCDIPSGTQPKIHGCAGQYNFPGNFLVI